MEFGWDYDESSDELKNVKENNNNYRCNYNDAGIMCEWYLQVFAAMAKNLIVVNKALFDGFPSIVLPALQGTSHELNPNETLNISSSEASWLCMLLTKRLFFNFKNKKKRFIKMDQYNTKINHMSMNCKFSKKICFFQRVLHSLVIRLAELLVEDFVIQSDGETQWCWSLCPFLLHFSRLDSQDRMCSFALALLCWDSFLD